MRFSDNVRFIRILGVDLNPEDEARRRDEEMHRATVRQRAFIQRFWEQVDIDDLITRRCDAAIRELTNRPFVVEPYGG